MKNFYFFILVIIIVLGVDKSDAKNPKKLISNTSNWSEEELFDLLEKDKGKWYSYQLCKPKAKIQRLGDINHDGYVEWVVMLSSRIGQNSGPCEDTDKDLLYWDQLAFLLVKEKKEKLILIKTLEQYVFTSQSFEVDFIELIPTCSGKISIVFRLGDQFGERWSNFYILEGKQVKKYSTIKNYEGPKPKYHNTFARVESERIYRCLEISSEYISNESKKPLDQ